MTGKESNGTHDEELSGTALQTNSWRSYLTSGPIASEDFLMDPEELSVQKRPSNAARTHVRE